MANFGLRGWGAGGGHGFIDWLMAGSFLPWSARIGAAARLYRLL